MPTKKRKKSVTVGKRATYRGGSWGRKSHYKTTVSKRGKERSKSITAKRATKLVKKGKAKRA